MERPRVLCGDLDELPALLAECEQSHLRYDLIIGRNSLTDHPDKARAALLLAGLLDPEGTIGLIETVPRHTQRLDLLLDLSSLNPGLVQRLRDAEEAIYDDADDPMTNWDVQDLVESFVTAGAEVLHTEQVEVGREYLLTEQQIVRWFEINGEGRPSYAEHLRRELDDEEIEQVRALAERQLTGETVRWRSTVVLLTARPSAPD
jgi:putative ATPase